MLSDLSKHPQKLDNLPEGSTLIRNGPTQPTAILTSANQLLLYDTQPLAMGDLPTLIAALDLQGKSYSKSSAFSFPRQSGEKGNNCPLVYFTCSDGETVMVKVGGDSKDQAKAEVKAVSKSPVFELYELAGNTLYYTEKGKQDLMQMEVDKEGKFNAGSAKPVQLPEGVTAGKIADIRPLVNVDGVLVVMEGEKGVVIAGQESAGVQLPKGFTKLSPVHQPSAVVQNKKVTWIALPSEKKVYLANFAKSPEYVEKDFGETSDYYAADNAVKIAHKNELKVYSLDKLDPKEDNPIEKHELKDQDCYVFGAKGQDVFSCKPKGKVFSLQQMNEDINMKEDGKKTTADELKPKGKETKAQEGAAKKKEGGAQSNATQKQNNEQQKEQKTIADYEREEEEILKSPHYKEWLANHKKNQKTFDCSGLPNAKYKQYNALKDMNLYDHFHNQNIKDILIHQKIIDKEGFIVKNPNSEIRAYEAKIIEKEKAKQLQKDREERNRRLGKPILSQEKKKKPNKSQEKAKHLEESQNSSTWADHSQSKHSNRGQNKSHKSQHGSSKNSSSVENGMRTAGPFVKDGPFLDQASERPRNLANFEEELTRSKAAARGIHPYEVGQSKEQEGGPLHQSEHLKGSNSGLNKSGAHSGSGANKGHSSTANQQQNKTANNTSKPAAKDIKPVPHQDHNKFLDNLESSLKPAVQPKPATTPAQPVQAPATTQPAQPAPAQTQPTKPVDNQQQEF